MNIAPVADQSFISQGNAVVVDGKVHVYAAPAP
jgi:hypothetical protein